MPFGHLLFLATMAAGFLGVFVFASFDEGPKASLATICAVLLGATSALLFIAHFLGLIRSAYCVTNNRAIAWQHVAWQREPTVGEVWLQGARADNSFINLTISQYTPAKGRRDVLIAAPRIVRREIARLVAEVNQP